MLKQIFNNSDLTYNETIQPIELGGTGATTAPEALVNLDLVPMSTAGQANGPVPLDENNLVPNQYRPVGAFTINGDTIYQKTREINAGQTSDIAMVITNYDCQRPYIGTAEYGTVEIFTRDVVEAMEENVPGSTANINHGDIRYTAPAAPCVDIITINASSLTINVV